MRRALPFVIVTLVGLLVSFGAILLYRAKRPPTLQLSPEQTALARVNPEVSRARGPADAPVTLEEFADLQCPPCGALSEPINQLVKDYRGRLRVVFRHLPIASHAHARTAALAVEAAALQGRFWPMHDLLYREQSAWGRAADVRPIFEAYAGTLGLDLNRFRKDVDSEETKAQVAADEQRGAKLGISITPTILLNGSVVPSDALRPDRLRARVEAMVKAQTVQP